MRKLSVLVFALSMICSQGLSAQEDSGDAALTARVKAALIDDEATQARQIDVETRNDVVQLSGFVDSEEARRAALTTARAVPGVAEVRNDLVVRETDRTAGEVVDDTVIAAKVKTQLQRDADLASDSEVNVEVNEGVVQLSGFVSTVEEKNRAADAGADVASNVVGVKDVHNNIALER